MRKVILALLLFTPAIARAQDCDDAAQISVLKKIETYDGVVVDYDSPADRYSRAMHEIGNWDINLIPIKVVVPEPKDLLEEQEWYGPEYFSMRSIIPRGYRPLRYEPVVFYHFGRGDRFRAGLYAFESRTNLNYQERLITGLSNERAIGGAVLISLSW